jgi:hypothetical protein
VEPSTGALQKIGVRAAAAALVCGAALFTAARASASDVGAGAEPSRTFSAFQDSTSVPAPTPAPQEAVSVSVGGCGVNLGESIRPLPCDDAQANLVVLARMSGSSDPTLECPTGTVYASPDHPSNWCWGVRTYSRYGIVGSTFPGVGGWLPLEGDSTSVATLDLTDGAIRDPGPRSA